MNTTHFTGFSNGVFLVDGTPSKQIVQAAEARGWLRFPSREVRNYLLANGPRPRGLIDGLPDDEPTEAAQ